MRVLHARVPLRLRAPYTLAEKYTTIRALVQPVDKGACVVNVHAMHMLCICTLADDIHTGFAVIERQVSHCCMFHVSYLLVVRRGRKLSFDKILPRRVALLGHFCLDTRDLVFVGILGVFHDRLGD